MKIVKEAGISKPSKIVKCACTRCDGTGTVHPFGDCFRCHGTGTDPKRLEYAFPADWSDEQAFVWQEARLERTEKGRQRRYSKLEADRKAQFARNAEQFPVLSVAMDMNNPSTLMSDLLEKSYRYPLTEKQGLLVEALVERRNQYEAVKEMNRIAQSGSEWVGIEGEPIQFTGTVELTKQIEGEYGLSILVVVVDSDGNRIKMFTTAEWVWEVEQGDAVALKAKVKKHEEYEGVKQTLVKCPKPISKVAPKQEALL